MPVTTAMNPLTKLIGGRDKVFLMRFFLREPGTAFSTRELRDLTGIDGRVLRSLISHLESGEMIVRVNPRIKKGKRQVKHETRWRLNTNASYIEQLRNLLAPVAVLSDDDVIRKFNRKGKPHLIVLSGFFSNMEEEDRILDLLFVGDRYDKEEVEGVVEEIEDEVGEEILYAFFTPQEFKYRREMQDRLLRELFTRPHRTLLNRFDKSL